MHVGLGSDIVGGYSTDLMDAVRWAVGVLRMREDARSESARAPGAHADENTQVAAGSGDGGRKDAEVEVDEEVKID
ncbi:hypothetical protein EW146_g5901 [Bondarzewia mesenterica]|uniref:Uncharacterized protein n=1 Tax=Bondarzewia mesenterica TaxID=1095465 RepID=A0A4S4LQ57_9AGAM|nr:hypothetical protein EW146_g5901 [Bondarzewia mesenterica]